MEAAHRAEVAVHYQICQRVGRSLRIRHAHDKAVAETVIREARRPLLAIGIALQYIYVALVELRRHERHRAQIHAAVGREQFAELQYYLLAALAAYLQAAYARVVFAEVVQPALLRLFVHGY